jgi:two-component system, response regulator YesN
MKILIIEDELMIRKGLRHQLECMDFQELKLEGIWEAEDGTEAEVLLDSLSFDIVFTDINMPEMDGITLLENWAKLHHDTQWVILSGHDSFQYAQKAISHGVKDYILKPLTKRKLSETVARLLDNLRKESDDFIEIHELENVLQSLEEAIWVLDEELVKKTVACWSERIDQKQVKSSYYQNVMNHLLQTLVKRINQKGSIRLEGTFLVSEKQNNEITNQFIDHCQKIIETVRYQRKGKVIDPIEAAKNYMMKNVGAKVNLDDVAQKLGLNSSYFSQLFKRETGQTFVEYRIHLRMEIAKKLLEQRNLRIIDISSEIGYDDAPHFTKTFKKYTGCSPTEYRQLLGIEV